MQQLKLMGRKLQRKLLQQFLQRFQTRFGCKGWLTDLLLMLHQMPLVHPATLIPAAIHLAGFLTCLRFMSHHIDQPNHCKASALLSTCKIMLTVIVVLVQQRFESSMPCLALNMQSHHDSHEAACASSPRCSALQFAKTS